MAKKKKAKRTAAAKRGLAAGERLPTNPPDQPHELKPPKVAKKLLRRQIIDQE